jgi:hypothetical protein
MGKNNQKQEKAKRNAENAKRFKKKPVRVGRGRPGGGFGGPKPASAPAAPGE